MNIFLGLGHIFVTVSRYEWFYFRIAQCVSYCRKKMRDYVKGGGALWRPGGSLHLRQYQRQATPVTPRCVRALA